MTNPYTHPDPVEPVDTRKGLTPTREEVERLVEQLETADKVLPHLGLTKVITALTALLAENERTDAIATDLQVLCDKQAKELARLKAPVEDDLVKCIHCGQDTMHMGAVCYSCANRVSTPQLNAVIAERDALNEKLMTMQYLWGEMLERYKGYKKDSERYRWLRHPAILGMSEFKMVRETFGCEEHFDAAIDAAMVSADANMKKGEA